MLSWALLCLRTCWVSGLDDAVDRARLGGANLGNGFLSRSSSAQRLRQRGSASVAPSNASDLDTLL